MAPIDPHSFTDSKQPFAAYITLSLYVDFSTSVIHGCARISLASPRTGPLSLDTRSLTLHSVLDPVSLANIPFSISPPDPIKGCNLVVSLFEQSSFIIVYSTTPSSSALQWLSPSQTFGKKLPFVYTQCQSIHARSVFPCQDTPAARVAYTCRINIPREMSAVMAARHVERRDPISKEVPALACGNSLWCSEDRVVEEFKMEEPVPPYLFAFAVGDLGFREVGPRTRVYAEAAPALLDDAAREFAGTEDMIRQGEQLFGPYEWERFDLLVLPPSFPYGGMENPRMVFLTPTVIKGDASGAQVVAHELAHSWTGNLITNKTNDHFWLNEV